MTRLLSTLPLDLLAMWLVTGVLALLVGLGLLAVLTSLAAGRLDSGAAYGRPQVYRTDER